MTLANDKFYKTTITLNNHHLTIKMLAEEFAADMKVSRKYMIFYFVYSRVFGDVLALDALLKTRFAHQIIDTLRKKNIC